MNVSEKNCIECGEAQPFTEYYKHSQMADGHINKCKSCTRAAVKANKRSNEEYYLAYDRERGNRQPSGYLKQYRADNPEKYKAHNKVNNAIRDGKLEKEPCYLCGAAKVQAHHPDYSKPLNVIWMCSKCHKRIHSYEEKKAEIMN